MSTSDTERRSAADSDRGTPPRGKGPVARPWRVFAVVLVLAFVNMAVWSLATPLFASPDEPAQVARAVALVHGQLIGKTVKNAGNADHRRHHPQGLRGRDRRTGDASPSRTPCPPSCATTAHPIEGRGADHHLCRALPAPVLRHRRPALALHRVLATGSTPCGLSSALLNAVFLALAAAVHRGLVTEPVPPGRTARGDRHR